MLFAVVAASYRSSALDVPSQGEQIRRTIPQLRSSN